VLVFNFVSTNIVGTNIVSTKDSTGQGFGNNVIIPSSSSDPT
jgi:hypothetical protein